MTLANAQETPKTYILIRTDSYNYQSPEVTKRVLNTPSEITGCFDERTLDRFYNEKLELGKIFSIKRPSPIKGWHKARKGTTIRFQGHLSKIFPELDKLSDKKLDMLIRRARSREETV